MHLVRCLFCLKTSSPRLTRERLHSKERHDGGFGRDVSSLKTTRNWRLMFPFLQLVMMGTGKSKLRSLVPEPFHSLLDFPSGMMPLCRGTIHPLIPNMAFCGDDAMQMAGSTCGQTV
ncbi:hypothetical protein RHMOL_Rhmol08G0035700 [Rhododendron molle]|uniref:Uncharacterized protein n=1 Tax=Rhododendron molle TaxID=49168 RepID=A0ACC0MKH2_RHOML|nr:hypothetical protein RHMOL_Rhmol08G0035700 [Rhododendron molle]